MAQQSFPSHGLIVDEKRRDKGCQLGPAPGTSLCLQCREEGKNPEKTKPAKSLTMHSKDFLLANGGSFPKTCLKSTTRVAFFFGFEGAPQEQFFLLPQAALLIRLQQNGAIYDEMGFCLLINSCKGVSHRCQRSRDRLYYVARETSSIKAPKELGTNYLLQSPTVVLPPLLTNRALFDSIVGVEASITQQESADTTMDQNVAAALPVVSPDGINSKRTFLGKL